MRLRHTLYHKHEFSLLSNWMIFFSLYSYFSFASIIATSLPLLKHSHIASMPLAKRIANHYTCLKGKQKKHQPIPLACNLAACTVIYIWVCVFKRLKVVCIWYVKEWKCAATVLVITVVLAVIVIIFVVIAERVTHTGQCIYKLKHPMLAMVHRTNQRVNEQQNASMDFYMCRVKLGFQPNNFARILRLGYSILYCTIKRKMLSLTLKKERERENIAAQAAAAAVAAITATAPAPKHKLKCAHAHFSDKCSSIEEIYCISGSMATFLFLHRLSIANCRRVGIRVRCERVRVCILSLALRVFVMVMCFCCTYLYACMCVCVTWYFDIVVVSIFLPFVLMPAILVREWDGIFSSQVYIHVALFQQLRNTPNVVLPKVDFLYVYLFAFLFFAIFLSPVRFCLLFNFFSPRFIHKLELIPSL